LQSGELAKGGTVAEKSFLILVLVGIVEISVGILSLSIALVADGVYSFADAAVSLIVWVGLRLSRKAADGKFHFGYYRIETFSSMVAALLMAVLGGIVLYESYLTLCAPRQLVNAELALAVAFAATIIAVVMSVFKRRAAKKYASLALKTDAFNSIKDWLTSITAFLGIMFSRYFGFVETDSIAGIVISLFVFTVSYSIIREASLVLVDACSCEEILSDIEGIAKSVSHVRAVHSIRMRKVGPYLMGDMHVVVDPSMTVKEADEIATQIEEQVKEEFDEVTEIKVRIEPHEVSEKKAES